VLCVIPGRGHNLFRSWLSRLAGYLLRKVIYSAILAVLLAVSAAVADAASNLGWLMAFTLQALLMWSVFLQRDRIAGEFLAATAGPGSNDDQGHLLANTYFAARLTQMARSGGRRHGGSAPSASPARAESTPAPATERGVDVPEPGEYTGEPVASTEGDPAHYRAAVTDLDNENEPDPSAARGVDVPEPQELMDLDEQEEPVPDLSVARGVDVPEPGELMDLPLTGRARPDLDSNDQATE
jgi:hypothetical protein